MNRHGSHLHIRTEDPTLRGLKRRPRKETIDCRCSGSGQAIAYSKVEGSDATLRAVCPRCGQEVPVSYSFAKDRFLLEEHSSVRTAVKSRKKAPRGT